MNETIKFWANILVPPLVALIIGFGTSYLTVHTMLAEQEERINQIEKDTALMRSEIKEANVERGNTRERLAAIEAKIDILLMKASAPSEERR